MKISELKQPYRRMAEYLADRNTDKDFRNKEILMDAFNWFRTDEDFWHDIYYSKYPPITEEIKQYFPSDFDFSGEKPICSYSINSLGQENISLFDKENQRKIEDENLQKRIYTQLVKEGKFDELPDTCEFSEPVELEVWDNVEPIKMNDFDLRLVSGKFKGVFIAQNSYASNKYVIWQHAKLPTPKIDFSKFKSGDVVEVELVHNETRIGWFDYVDNNNVVINILKRKGNHVCNGGSCAGNKMFNLEKIKLITKIK